MGSIVSSEKESSNRELAAIENLKIGDLIRLALDQHKKISALELDLKVLKDRVTALESSGETGDGTRVIRPPVRQNYLLEDAEHILVPKGVTIGSAPAVAAGSGPIRTGTAASTTAASPPTRGRRALVILRRGQACLEEGSVRQVLKQLEQIVPMDGTDKILPYPETSGGAGTGSAKFGGSAAASTTISIGKTTESKPDVVLLFWASGAHGANDRSPAALDLEDRFLYFPFHKSTKFVFLVMRTFKGDRPSANEYKMDENNWSGRLPTTPIACCVTFDSTGLYWAGENFSIISDVAKQLSFTTGGK